MTGQPMSAETTDTASHPAAGGGNTLGDYTIGERRARREHADVYEATHTPSGAARLVYVLRPGAMQDNPLVHRVVCEADAARWLRHPAVAKVDGWGDTPNRRMYVAVERPAGRPLGEVIAAAGPMAPRNVVRLASRLVEVLDEAHSVALVHGRLTPDAVVMGDGADASGHPRVTLTGLGAAAIALDGAASEAERPYVSPEQLAGREADARSDVYGLASLLHFVLHAAAPDGAPPGAAATGATLGPTAQVLAAARAAEPARRPATVKAFWDDLLAALVADAAAEATQASAPVAGGVTAEAKAFEFDLDVIEPAGPSTWTVSPVAARETEDAPAPEFSFGGLDMSAARVPAKVPAWTPPKVPLRPAVAAEPAWSVPEPVEREPWSPPADTWQGGSGVTTTDAAPAAGRKKGVAAYALMVAVPVVMAAVGWPLVKGKAIAADAGAPVAPTAAVSAPSPAVASVVTAPPPPAPVAPGAATVAAGEAHAQSTHHAGETRHASRRDEEHADSKPDTPTVRLPRVDMPDLSMPALTGAERTVVVKSDEFAERRLLNAKPKP